MSKYIRVTWVKSSIGRKEVQRRTLKALGFQRLQQSLVFEVNPSLNGMVQRVVHLVQIEHFDNAPEGYEKRVSPIKKKTESKVSQ